MSREQILTNVKNNKPESTPLPETKFYKGQLDVSTITKFTQMLNRVGGTVHELTSELFINEFIKGEFTNVNTVASTVGGIDFTNVDLTNIVNPHELENIDLAIIRGEFGVAENGAVWLPGENLVHHALPFITQHLIIVVRKEDIVENMHLAYQRINLKSSVYGVFIAGPSKTADIEQSLVIGAHGSRSLLVILY